MTIDTTHVFVILTADDGKIFKNINTGNILTKTIYLGCNDRAENYIEIDEGDIYEEKQGNEEN